MTDKRTRLEARKERLAKTLVLARLDHKKRNDQWSQETLVDATRIYDEVCLELEHHLLDLQEANLLRIIKLEEFTLESNNEI